MKKVLLSVFLLGSFGLFATAAEYYTEYFGRFDLTGLSLTFTPDGSAEYYSADMQAADELPVDHSEHAALYLGDDNSVQMLIADGKRVALYGKSYWAVNVGSNGYLTFLAQDSNYSANLTNHFSEARISTFYDDLDPGDSLGAVKAKQLDDRLVVTFDSIPFYPGDTSGRYATFQTELFFNGVIRMTWMRCDLSYPGAIVGLSSGDGIPSDFTYTDLTSFGVDLDADGIADSWEATHFGHYNNCVSTNDFDSDSFDNISEYICGSDPRNKDSFFTIEADFSGNAPVITWNALEGRRYSIYKTTSLSRSFELHQDLYSPQNSFTDTAGEAAFYKLEVQLQE